MRAATKSAGSISETGSSEDSMMKQGVEEEPSPSVHKVGPDFSIRHICSIILTIFSIVMIASAIFTKQTKGTAERNIPTFLAFIIFWGLLIFLAFLEGALNCIVGLKPIDKSLYQHSHPLTYKCAVAAHQGDNTERFIVGRQYLDLMCVFLTSVMVSSVDGAAVLGLPDYVNEIFLAAGLAVVLITIIFGQLVAQINAAHSMLDFMNNWAHVLAVYTALAVEASGILHSVYLVQIIFSKVSGNDSAPTTQRTACQKFLFWARVIMSTGLVLAASVITVVALYQKHTTAWESVPPTVSLVLLIVLIFVGGLMEGLQIALFKVLHLPKSDLATHKVARRNCDLVFDGKLEKLLIGRQILQTVIMFLIARISTLERLAEDEKAFGVSGFIQTLFDTGVAGALISTVIASLSWRVLANSFPFIFLSNPFAYWIIQICLSMEATGVCYSSWILADINRWLVKYKRDEVYIGAAADKEDDILHLAEITHTDSDDIAAASEESC